MAVNVPDTARCRVCDYLLRGLPGPVCPECGTHFDPNDPATFRDPARPKERRVPKPLEPPSVFYLSVLGCLIAGLMLWRGTVVGAIDWYTAMDEEGGCWVYLLVAAPLMDYVRRWVRVRDRRAMVIPDLLEELDRHIGRWRALTVLVVLLVVLMVWPLSAALRFYASWPALDAAANKYLVNPSAPTGRQWIGLFHVEQIWGRGQGFVWFEVQHNGAGDRYGIARYEIPPWQADSGRGRSRISLGAGWYIERW